MGALTKTPARARRPLTLGLLAAVGLLGLSAQAESQLGVEARGSALAQALDDAESARNEQSRLEGELEALVGRRNGARQRLRSHVRTFYRLRRAGALPLAGGFEALLTHQARVDRLERMVQRDVDGLRRMDSRVGELRGSVAQVAGRIEALDARAEELRAEEQAQLDQMEILSGMIEDPAAWSGPAMGGGGFGIRYSDGAPLPGGLASERGRLPLPVSGSVQLRDAQREGGAGLDVLAELDARVRAVAPGRVAYAAAHPGYGRLVILEHPGEYFTVYGGLGRVTVQTGDAVPREAVLGVVGPQALFFQVRRGTRPLSAREWLGI